MLLMLESLAGKLGVSEKTVSFWVNDNKNPSVVNDMKLIIDT